MTDQGPEYSPFFAVMGASAAMVFSGKYHLSQSSNFVNNSVLNGFLANPVNH